MTSTERCDEVLASLRRIIRAIDLQSRELVRRYGLTGPQMVLLRELMRLGEVNVTDLARQVNLSQATVTDILNRLEQRGMIQRCKSDRDRRRVRISATEAARQTVDFAVPVLQENFIRQFSAMNDWEQLQLLSSLGRVADMMNVKNFPAGPVMSGDQITATVTTDKIAVNPSGRNYHSSDISVSCGESGNSLPSGEVKPDEM
jgi:DNA-binding MarR family transcriptional regulator